MNLDFERQFKKQYKKLPKKIQNHFDERLVLFLEHPNHPLLRIHELKGDMSPLQSMNINGDYRALFTIDIKKRQIIFYKIGTHSELY